MARRPRRPRRGTPEPVRNRVGSRRRHAGNRRLRRRQPRRPRGHLGGRKLRQLLEWAAREAPTRLPEPRGRIAGAAVGAAGAPARVRDPKSWGGRAGTKDRRSHPLPTPKGLPPASLLLLRTDTPDGGSVLRHGASAKICRAPVAYRRAAPAPPASISTPPGPVAHLVERRHGMAEATGSIPVGSTTSLSGRLRLASQRSDSRCPTAD